MNRTTPGLRAGLKLQLEKELGIYAPRRRSSRPASRRPARAVGKLACVNGFMRRKYNGFLIAAQLQGGGARSAVRFFTCW